LVESITEEKKISSLQNDWDRLSCASEYPNVFMTADWFQSWYEDLARRSGAGKLKPSVLSVKRDGIITGIAPLSCAVTSRYGMELRRLQFLARDHEWDYNDLVVGDDVPGQTAALVDFLCRTKSDWELIDLQDLRDAGGALEHFRTVLTKSGLPHLVVPAEERCPYMPIDGTWAEMLGRRSSVTRHSFRNRQSRLNRLTGGELRIRILDDPQNESGLLDRMIALEMQKQVGGRISIPFLGQHAGVFVSLFDKLGPKGWLCVAVMEWNDRLLSWHLLFRCGKRLWGYLTAYDHEFARLSPGTMMIPAIVDHGFAQGCTEYDFLSGEEPYKMQWATGFHHRYRVLIWNERPKSRLYAAAYRRQHIRAVESSGDELAETQSVVSTGE
jgi:CelD/BcsL family acetyltransferase involved in cellulose biosynthesis